MAEFNGVKVFSATMIADRMMLGEKVTEWLAQHPTYQVVDMLVTQSSDSQFHCITQSSDSQFHCIAITVWYRDPAHVARTLPARPKMSAEGDETVKRIRLNFGDKR